MFIHMFICMSQRFNVQSIYYFSENLAKDIGRMYASGLLRVVKCLIIVNAQCTAGKSPTNRYIGNSGPWLIVARPIDSCMIIPSHSHSSHIICQSFLHPKPLILMAKTKVMMAKLLEFAPIDCHCSLQIETIGKCTFKH